MKTKVDKFIEKLPKNFEQEVNMLKRVVGSLENAYYMLLGKYGADNLSDSDLEDVITKLSEIYPNLEW